MQAKLKFKKLPLEHEPESTIERKKSQITLKTERLNSLERYSTIQEQRENRNEKIHLNLIERKLFNGTYDEKKETGNDLTQIKQKRDQLRSEMSGRQK